MLFKRKNNHKEEFNWISRSVKEYMRKKYNLSNEYLFSLGCLEYKGFVKGEMVRCIRIFNSHKARQENLTVTEIKKSDLDRHPEMILFEGYVDKQGNIFLDDLRAKANVMATV